MLAKLHKYNMDFFCGRFPYTMTQKTASYDKKSKRPIYSDHTLCVRDEPKVLLGIVEGVREGIVVLEMVCI